MRVYKIMAAALAVSIAILATLGTVGSSARVSETYLKDISCSDSACSVEFNQDIEIAKALDTGSMLPTFDDDTLIIAKPDSLGIGDIVLYRSGKDLIVHRIVGIDSRAGERYYKMKGDNNLWDDGWFPESAIEWKVIGVLY
ncbi:MAG: S24/S26 family peptidase [Candidatus Aenigmatarchaeota archaeon]